MTPQVSETQRSDRRPHAAANVHRLAKLALKSSLWARCAGLGMRQRLVTPIGGPKKSGQCRQFLFPNPALAVNTIYEIAILC
jgi:hypothetical protein